MHFLLHLIIALAAAPSTAQSFNDGPNRIVHEPNDEGTANIVTRDLPPCPPCPGGEHVWSRASQWACAHIDPRLLREGRESFHKHYPADYWPTLCDHGFVNCITLEPGVSWKEPGGLSPRLGHYARADGSSIDVWCYWQSTLLYTGALGSGTTYNAHCAIYTCVKGRMNAEVTPGGTIRGGGNGDGSNRETCKCFSRDYVRADIKFYLS
ncbi:secreted protein [Teratosphaeria destructans]|uniref:Secreted protein n=1 Tax=Teratosphaeria destructans TaxID=418781 RepID=A0A9W7W265_9PEZI|nr:secreted protein [Teratosphaeria destructans]